MEHTLTGAEFEERRLQLEVAEQKERCSREEAMASALTRNLSELRSELHASRAVYDNVAFEVVQAQTEIVEEARVGEAIRLETQRLRDELRARECQLTIKDDEAL